MSIYTSQYEEHLDAIAGEASEFQNCFTEAQQVAFELGAKESVAINKAKALGLFVVVLEIPYFCRSTDALVGCYNRFVCAFPSREAAEAKIQKLYSKLSEYDSGDYNYSVIQPA